VEAVRRSLLFALVLLVLGTAAYAAPDVVEHYDLTVVVHADRLEVDAPLNCRWRPPRRGDRHR